MIVQGKQQQVTGLKEKEECRCFGCTWRLHCVENGKPHKVMHDNGKQFTSKIFKGFLKKNKIKDKPIPKFYPQLPGKIEAYNKIVKNEFLAIENIPNVNDGKKMYSMFVKAYNEDREHMVV